MFRYLLMVGCCGLPLWGHEEPGREALDLFEKQVRPVLAENCFSCHGPAKQKAGLRLDSRDAILKGGESGPALVPGEPASSRLLAAVSYVNVDLQMPPRGKLPDASIQALTAWVALGAPWPSTDPGVVSTTDTLASFDLQARKRAHWAWQPLTLPALPSVSQGEWPRTAVDRFVLARLEAEGLAPSPPAEKAVLLWRVTHDLVGLAPTSQELAAFVMDADPNAYERRVDQLLESPRFGEHWARHWFDLVRYAETLGHEFDYVVPNAWRYRDYIIDALNQDLPHDQLIREHVAGDLLEPPRRGAGGENESVKGTAFYWFTQQTHSPVDQAVQTADRIENQIDVLTKTFLGLTVACARCHDHKFDAISTRDYYGFYGYFASSRYTQASFDAPERIAAKAARLAQLRTTIAELEDTTVQASISTVPGASTGEPSVPQGDILFASFDRDLAGWLPDGAAWDRGVAPTGTTMLRGDGDLPEIVVLRGGWAHSGLLSARLQGALRSPTFAIEQRYIHLLVAGHDTRVNVVVDGFNVIRDPIYGGLKRGVGREAPHWLTFDVERWRGRRAHIELNDLQPGDLSHGDHGARGWLAISAAVFSTRPEVPAQLAVASSFEARQPSFSADNRLRAQELWREYRTLEAAIPAPTYVPAMADGDGESVRVFVRGSPHNPGEPAPRQFLEALGSAPEPLPGEGSGRLELARRLTDPSNPLTARVHVNRLWHHVFGRGIVATVDDFGVLGQKPSHPELLDWLATTFQQQGWSTKKLLRLLVTSSVYRQSSLAGGVADERDPQNIWYHRASIRRLGGEAIRDRILALSGGLNLAGSGPSVPVNLTSFMEGRGRPGHSGPLDGARKRSVFLEVRRNFLSPFFAAFDTPLPASTVGRRNVSNVPAQALILLNDPFVQEESTKWARELLRRPGLDTRARIHELYLGAFGRQPTATELEETLHFLDEQAQGYGLEPEARTSSVELWGDLCHVLINAKEFIFIH